MTGRWRVVSVFDDHPHRGTVREPMSRVYPSKAIAEQGAEYVRNNLGRFDWFAGCYVEQVDS